MRLQEVLSESVAARRVPGASAAVLAAGEVTEAAAGVLNVGTGVEATTDSVFEIGSITKVYTATLVLQLVEAGLVDLDAPVRRYVPDFRVADPDATDAITVHQLLTHTSGFDGGDHFFDGGRGDDALERYVASLAGLGQITPPGERWSYSNAGFTVLGRLVETVTGELYDDALRTRLLEPAGLVHSMTLLEDVVRFRAAHGHALGADGNVLRTDMINRSAGPAGGVRASAGDVVGFARLHLDGGRVVLSPTSVTAMQAPRAVMPGPLGDRFGLAWWLRDLDGVRAIGHDGGTLGQHAFLMAFPDHGVAIALLTNGPTGGAVWNDVAEHVTSELGLPSLRPRLPRPPEPPVAIDLSKYAATYERCGVRQTVFVEDGRLQLASAFVDMAYDFPAPPTVAMFPVDDHTFVALRKNLEPAAAFTFLDFDADGCPQLLFAGRLARRVAT